MSETTWVAYGGAGYHDATYYIDGTCEVVVTGVPAGRRVMFAWTFRRTRMTHPSLSVRTAPRTCLGLRVCPECDYTARPLYNADAAFTIARAAHCHGACAARGRVVPLQHIACAATIRTETRADGALVLRHTGEHTHAPPPGRRAALSAPAAPVDAVVLRGGALAQRLAGLPGVALAATRREMRALLPGARGVRFGAVAYSLPRVDRSKMRVRALDECDPDVAAEWARGAVLVERRDEVVGAWRALWEIGRARADARVAE